MIRGLVVGAHGGVSGRLILGGATYTFSGAFNGSGVANLNARATNGLGVLNVQLMLPPGATTLTGFVHSMNQPPWSASLLAGRISTARESTQFTMLVPPDPSDPAGPPGYGYAVGSTLNDVATLSGAMADGAAFSESAPILTNSQLFPLYASIDNGAGLLLGWLDFSGGAPQGTVWLLKQPSPVGSLYREGFTNEVAVQSSIWTKPEPHQPGAELTSLTISGGNVPAPLSFNVGINDENALVKTGGPTNSLTGFINPGNGVLRITFGNGPGRSTTLGVGAILQNSNVAGGFFSGAYSAGVITSP